MEPTSALIGTFVVYMSNYLKDNKSFKDFIGEFTDATISWIKPIFLKEDEAPTDEITDLEENPDDEINQSDVKNKIAKHLRKNPDLVESLKKTLSEIKKNDADWSKVQVNQTHYGSGDNIARDKNINYK